MACIEAATWNKAYNDCANMNAAVRGMGGVPRLRALRGLGDLAVSPGYDPCAIAAQPSCQPRPPGMKAATTVNPNPPGPITQTVSTAATAGFSHWGILAAVLVGGFVIYKVAQR